MEFINEITEKIWQDKYQKNGETYDENLRRVADFCGQTEEEKWEFLDVMKKGFFFPAGRTMSNSGIGRNLTLNNCYVSPLVQDDLVDIFSKVTLGAKTHKAGGGIGFDFSQIRPKGTPTSNDAIASGALSFMDVFNAQTETILQGNRRGANIGVMNVYDIDICDFIIAKSKDSTRLQHFNLSVMIDDDFMEAVQNNENIFLHHPVYDKQGKILKNPKDWEISKEVSANEIWDLIMENAYNNGEPGIFFYDTLNRDNNLHYIENIVCTNPCAEYLAGTIYGNSPITHELLNPNEYGGACNLGSIFLHNFVKNPFTSEADLDILALKKAVRTAVRFLDSVIDINKFPDVIYENYQKNFRTIGLGVTGFADMLAMIGLRYDSNDAIRYANYVINKIAKSAYRASIELAKEKGEFPFLKREEFIKSGYLTKHAEIDTEWEGIRKDILKYGIRNAKLLSVAPTGTISMAYGNNCSSGIEPIFCLEYDRKIKIGGQSEENARIVPMRDYAYQLWKDNVETNVRKDVFTTALNISVDDHIKMLSTIAYHIDMSVSKTINVPSSYTLEQTKNIYIDCWRQKIKGCTIFRPNEIRQGILIDKSTQPIKEELLPKDEPSQFPRGVVESVPDYLSYKKYKLETGCGSLYLFLGIDESDGRIYDCFTNTDGTGGCSVNTQANSRLLSLCLRGGIPIDKIIQQLNKSGTCPSFQYHRGAGKKLCAGKSCPSAIANVLKDVLKESELMQEEEIETPSKIQRVEKIIETHGFIAEKSFNNCPECNASLVNEGGCKICKQCGYSKCN